MSAATATTAEDRVVSVKCQCCGTPAATIVVADGVAYVIVAHRHRRRRHVTAIPIVDVLAASGYHVAASVT